MTETDNKTLIPNSQQDIAPTLNRHYTEYISVGYEILKTTDYTAALETLFKLTEGTREYLNNLLSVCNSFGLHFEEKQYIEAAINKYYSLLDIIEPMTGDYWCAAIRLTLEIEKKPFTDYLRHIDNSLLYFRRFVSALWQELGLSKYQIMWLETYDIETQRQSEPTIGPDEPTMDNDTATAGGRDLYKAIAEIKTLSKYQRERVLKYFPRALDAVLIEPAGDKYRWKGPKVEFAYFAQRVFKEDGEVMPAKKIESFFVNITRLSKAVSVLKDVKAQSWRQAYDEKIFCD